MRVLVTGAGGFIGSHLVRALDARGVDVRALVHHRASVAGLPSGVEALVDDVVTGNMAAATAGCAVVFHLAGPYRGSAAALRRAHVDGTTAVVEGMASSAAGVAAAAVGAPGASVGVPGASVGVPGAPEGLPGASGSPPPSPAEGGRLVLVSSTSVYGWDQAWPVDESSPTTPTSAYGWAKLEAERVVLARPGSVIVRPTIVYGPGDEHGMLARTVTLLRRGVRWLPGDGANRVDLLHVDDLVAGLLRVGLGEAPPSPVYLFGGPAPVVLRDAVDELASLAGVRAPVWGVVPASAARVVGAGVERAWALARRPGEAPISEHSVEVATRDRAYTCALATRELGWAPKVELGEGLRALVKGWPGTESPLAGASAVAARGGGLGVAPLAPAAADRDEGGLASAPVTASDATSTREPSAVGFQWRGYFDDPDEGLGTVYERFGLDRILAAVVERTGARSVLHAPAFGMMGIPGLDAVLLARRGVRVGLADHDAQRLDAVVGLWRRLGLSPEAHLLPSEGPEGWPADLGVRYDLVFSFAALWWYDDPWAVVRAQAAWAGRALVTAVPNKNVFMRMRAALWHRALFDELNEDALDTVGLAAMAPSLGMEVTETGLFDMPPFPDTSVPLAKVVRAAMGRFRPTPRTERSAATPQETAWSWSILPYLEGDAPDLPARIERIGAFERHFPAPLAPAWAHHRYVVMDRVPPDGSAHDRGSASHTT